MSSSLPWRRLGAALFGNVGLQVASAGLLFVTTAILGRYLGPAGVGVYAVAQAAVTIGSIGARLGLEPVMVRRVAVMVAERDGGGLAGAARAGFALTLAAASLLAMGFVAVPWRIGTSPDLATTLTVAVAPLVLLTGLAIGSALLRGLGHVVLANVPTQLIRPTVLVSLVAAAWGFGAPNAPWVAMAAHGIACFAGVLVLVTSLAVRWPSFARGVAPTGGTRTWLSAGLPLLLLGGLGVLNRQTDLVMLGALAPAAQAGAYSVAAQIAGLATYVLQASNMVVAPRFASLHADGDDAGLQRLAASSSAVVLALTLPLAMGLGVFAEPLLGLFGDGFEPGAMALRVLLVGWVANAGAGAVVQLLLMTKHDRDVVWTFTGTALLNVVLNAALVPSYGATGAAIATACATILWNGVLVLVVRRRLGVDATALGLLWRRR